LKEISLPTINKIKNILLQKTILLGIVIALKPEVLTIVVMISMLIVQYKLDQDMLQDQRDVLTAAAAVVLCASLWLTNGYFPFTVWWPIASLVCIYSFRTAPKHKNFEEQLNESIARYTTEPSANLEDTPKSGDVKTEVNDYSFSVTSDKPLCETDIDIAWRKIFG